ncbi:hypothetical protein [Nocardia miyunensis]|uniref:hypothetical protein n=1 Tax=Nocardia miyunensis TaxID=282684 RepID=UPI0012F4A927|nr:hypothetical protein [Nocardia miyunensis]
MRSVLTLLALLVTVPSLAALVGWTCVAATCWHEIRYHYRQPPPHQPATRTRTPALR